MSGDFTRNSFDPAKFYSAVRMQQGRLFTDADWNEQADIHRHDQRAGREDMIGASGFPADDAGFELIEHAASGSFIISGGSAYIDGIRIINDTPERLRITHVSGTGANKQWKLEVGSRLNIGDFVAPDLTDPTKAVSVTETREDGDGWQIFKTSEEINPGAGGVLYRLIRFENQPYLPGAVVPDTAGQHLFCLVCRDHPVGVLDDPTLREPAFGGVDTAVREKTIWQVKSFPVDELISNGAITNPVSCASLAPGWTPHGNKNRSATLTAKTRPMAAADNPCSLPPSAGYRSLENHLYRIEIHNGGTEGDASYKWSRDNGIHLTRYESIEDNSLIVESTGRDESTGLRSDDWIEITDNEQLLDEAPGFFARIAEVNGNRVGLAEIRDPDQQPLTDNGMPDFSKLPNSAQVRRWEGGLPQKLVADSWLAIENGIEVQFGIGLFLPGAYWTIPARAITGGIEWPHEEASGAPLKKPAEGTKHHYAALAIGELDNGGQWTNLTDCRRIFAALTDQKQFSYLGGDGQEIAPNPLSPSLRTPLKAPLLAGVVRGSRALEGEVVRFKVTGGDGRFDTGSTEFISTTDNKGVARANWHLDAATQIQRVEAELLNSAGKATHAPIIYTANLSRAEEVSFSPGNTPALAGANNVQNAIEMLAGMQQIGCSTHVITEESDWVAIFKSLKEGENVSICFTRSTFTCNAPVEIKKLGHVRITGAGEGSKIIAHRSECALDFINCSSLTIRDISISAPDGSAAVGHIKHRRGTINAIGCKTVDISNSAVRCGAGITPQRSCISIRGDSSPTRSVHIERNRLTVGYMQEGILVIDCANSQLNENEFTVSPRPGTLPVRKLIEDKLFRKRLIDLLVANPTREAFIPGKNMKGIRGGKYTAYFHSTVPQSEWDALVNASPPSDAQTASMSTFKNYADKLSEKALKNPDELPSYRKQLDRLSTEIGSNEFQRLNQKVLASLLMGSSIKVMRFDKVQARERQVVLNVNNARLAFNSPMSQADWNKATRVTSGAEKVKNGQDLLNLAHVIAEKIVMIPNFRKRFGSAVNWFEKLKLNTPSCGAQGIVCGGRVIGSTSIRNNSVQSFEVGIRVATSHRDDKIHSAGSVDISGNRMSLLVPGEGLYSPYGLFVGNVKTVRISDNDLSASSAPNYKTPFAQGIRVWGYLDKFLTIERNRISIATMGIRVNQVALTNRDKPYIGVIADNLIEYPHHRTVRAMKITPDWFIDDRNNVLG